MIQDKNNFNKIISEMEASFQISKASMESYQNDSKPYPNDSEHQITSSLAYSEHLDQNIKIQNLTHKENFISEIRGNSKDLDLIKDSIQILDTDNVLNSSQSFSSANNPI
jgi:hypothetical protein